jgi:hypothetical protein
MEVSPSRAGGFHAPQTETHGMKIRLPASHFQSVAFPTPQGNWIRALTSLWRGRLAGKLERSGPFGARFPAIFPRQGTFSGFVNFCRPLVAAGKPSFLRIPFVDHCSEATNSITNWLIFSPVQLSPCALNHAHKKAWRRTHGVQRNSATGASNE